MTRIIEYAKSGPYQASRDSAGAAGVWIGDPDASVEHGQAYPQGVDLGIVDFGQKSGTRAGLFIRSKRGDNETAKIDDLTPAEVQALRNAMTDWLVHIGVEHIVYATAQW